MASIMCSVELSVPELSLLRDVVTNEINVTSQRIQYLDRRGSYMAELTRETRRRLKVINAKIAEALAGDDPS